MHATTPMASYGSAPSEPPRRVNNKLIERMVAMRRDGFTMKAIAEACGVSERTVRRYVRGVEPKIKMPSELNSDEFTDWCYDQVLAPFEVGLDRVDASMKSLRELLAGMEPVSIRRLEADESLRAEFCQEFLADVARDWVAELNMERVRRRFVRLSGHHDEGADQGDSGLDV